ncbi:aspartyl-phosphate phosphatase Spo0E family protein [Paenibacillus brevis]|uniref:Aspartyl-phosphate phosphatase Spo0E family protein n=1 Tax=Paenibacillus brevis TaxID=2841508 RepID=A0ABS6FTH0_9BACL|nr:aspartyl-phosphate phosphatase Spo0E family protein [Paenibacillus brevis]MBU5673527.1 aspartyl-phosphate phosphatase Spo0E family protein [Paenibacillus brevis]
MTVSYFTNTGKRKPPVTKAKISNELSDMIEQLRAQLVHAAEHNGFCSDIVIELSQRLDTYIVMAQHEMVGQ